MLTRYEYANIYHTLGDWYNAVQAAALARVAGPQRLNVLFIDGHSKSMSLSCPTVKILLPIELLMIIRISTSYFSHAVAFSWIIMV